MSILKARPIPIPMFRRSPVPGEETAAPATPILQRPVDIAPSPKPAVGPVRAKFEAPKVEEEPAFRSAESPTDESPPSKRRSRNTRHPTIKPLDKPKPEMPDRKKGGRPRQIAHTVRDTKIVVSVSREEASIWHDCARREGRSMAEWVRRVVFDVAKVAPRPHPERDVAMGAIDMRNRK